MTDEQTKEMHETLERIYRDSNDIREYFKFLITIGLTSIPIVIGLIAFLASLGFDISGFKIWIILSGMILVFIAIPTSIMHVIPYGYPPNYDAALEILKKMESRLIRMYFISFLMFAGFLLIVISLVFIIVSV